MTSRVKLKISVITEPIGFSLLSKLHIGSVMVLGYLIFRFKSCPFEYRAPKCKGHSLATCTVENISINEFLHKILGGKEEI